MSSTTPRRICAVGFDFDHTLGIDNKLERVALLALLAELNLQGRSPESLESSIHSIDALLHRQRTGLCSIEEAVEAFAAEHGAHDAKAAAHRYKEIAMERAPSFVIGEPSTATVLSALRLRGVRYGMLTNGWSPLQQRKAALIGFDGPVLVSADLGVQKPASAAFTALAEILDTSPHEMAYVGDNPYTDVQGALAAGMQAFWYASDQVYPQDAPAPTAFIHDLAELPRLL